MADYFIADIHLNDDQPAITAGFLHFLHQLPNNSHLYILGDLFDYWVGDDALTPLHKKVADALLRLSSKQIKKYFVCGNRDFLLGQRYCQRCDMILLPDINLLASHSHRILFLHGDLLCTDDINYQQFRKKMHNKWLQRFFLCLPRYFRYRIAQKLRNTSSQHNQSKNEFIMDVNQATVIAMMSQYQADIMIHGHTHKPAIHQVSLSENKYAERMVLGAWHDGISYIKNNEHHQFELIQIPLESFLAL